MTVAIMESLALRQCLAAGTDDIARRFFRAADRLIDIPWQIAVGSDLQHPGVQGKRPSPLRFFNWYIAQLFRAAQTDVVLTTRFLEMLNLIRGAEIAGAPEIRDHPSGKSALRACFESERLGG